MTNEIMNCDIAHLKEALAGGVNLVDVREFPEFAGGRIEGARLMPLGDIEKRYTEIGHSETLYVICRTGRRSAEAAKKFSRLGFADVRNVSGGMEAWKSAGLPVEKDPAAVWSLERQVRFTAGGIVLLGALAAIFISSYLIAIPLFIGAGLVFSALTDTCGMALVLAKLPWNRQAAPTCEREAV